MDCDVTKIPPRIDVDPSEIETVVRNFYSKARTDQTLGPIFSVHVVDWEAHEAKIAAFWRNALLYERVYDGNPMQKHLSAGNVKPTHFATWLKLFDEVLFEVLPLQKAQAWSALAHRIGQGLRFGLQNYQTAGVPDLT